jgi:caffeoyl-CoA O-methyltransferase
MLATPGEAGTYDFAFIDADKPNYKCVSFTMKRVPLTGTNCRHYYERVLKLLRPGGLIAIDNVLWDGRVAETIDPADEKTQALYDLNKFILADERVEISMVPVSDGVTLCWKKPAQP